MQFENSDIDRAKVKQYISQIAFGENAVFDCCAWAILRQNGIVNVTPPISEEKLQLLFSEKEHKDRVIPKNNGPLFLYKEEDTITVTQTVNFIFYECSTIRDCVCDYFLDFNPGLDIGINTYREILKLKDSLLSEQWLQSAIRFHDLISEDWLCNLSGLKQSFEFQDDENIQDFATKVFRPSVNSIESIGIGNIEPSTSSNEYKQYIDKLFREKSSLYDIFDCFYKEYGFVPLNPVYFFQKLKRYIEDNYDSNINLWEELWGWANEKKSPVARYYVCSYYVSYYKRVPNGKFKFLLNEVLNVAYLPVNEESELEWSYSWRMRLELSRHYGQYLESRVPNSITEKVYTLAWWMTEQVSSIYKNSIKDIQSVRKYTIIKEEHWSHTIWRILRPKTVSSSLKYATLMSNSLWGLSVLSQVSNEFLQAFCIYNGDGNEKDKFINCLTGFLVACFPIKPIDNCIFSYDNGCIGAVEFLANHYPEKLVCDMLSAFSIAIRRLENPKVVVDELKNLGSFDEGNQSLLLIALRVLAYNNMLSKNEDELWGLLSSEESLTKLIISIKDDRISEEYALALMEIILQKQDKWAWQLPHLFSLIALNSENNKKHRIFMFGCVVLSSICSDTCSALKRLLLSGESIFEETNKEWEEHLRSIYNVAPDSLKCRLRPILLCFDMY